MYKISMHPNKHFHNIINIKSYCILIVHFDKEIKIHYFIFYKSVTNYAFSMQISSMRLPKDANKIKGYGYVEFEDRQSLIDALSMTNTVKTNGT
jgi:RNA recognition motif-containing protein